MAVWVGRLFTTVVHTLSSEINANQPSKYHHKTEAFQEILSKSLNYININNEISSSSVTVYHGLSCGGSGDNNWNTGREAGIQPGWNTSPLQGWCTHWFTQKSILVSQFHLLGCFGEMEGNWKTWRKPGQIQYVEVEGNSGTNASLGLSGEQHGSNIFKQEVGGKVFFIFYFF